MYPPHSQYPAQHGIVRDLQQATESLTELIVKITFVLLVLVLADRDLHECLWLCTYSCTQDDQTSGGSECSNQRWKRSTGGENESIWFPPESTWFTTARKRLKQGNDVSGKHENAGIQESQIVGQNTERAHKEKNSSIKSRQDSVQMNWLQRWSAPAKSFHEDVIVRRMAGYDCGQFLSITFCFVLC